MYSYHDIFFYYAFGTLNGGGGSIQVIGIAEGTTSVTFESNGKPIITYRIYGSSSGVGDLNAETGKYDITVTCNEDTYTISLDAPLMAGEYIDYKTQMLYPSGIEVSMPEISTVSGTNTLTVITTNPSSKVYVEYHRAKDVPIVSPNVVIGSVPFDFDCYEAWRLMDYSISGNAVQESTPSGEAPVDATGCGVRTGNLFDAATSVPGLLDDSGNVASNFAYGTSDFIPVNAPFTISLLSVYTTPRLIRCGYYTESKQHITNYDPAAFYDGYKAFPFTPPDGTACIRFSFIARSGYEDTNIMLNLGSTALPYEPYGYKLPLTVNGVEYPIYLGQAETTRRVKKLVLTGEERWIFVNNCFVFWFSENGFPTPKQEIIACSHYVGRTPTYRDYLNDGQCMITINQSQFAFRDSRFATVDDLKSYLATQYQNGTPVTVWYVLANEATGIVNEPLMRIGEYADTINLSQAGVDIPVIEGNNVLTINTDVPPSETYIKYNGKEKEYGHYITSDGYIYTTSDGYKYGIRS